MEYLCLVSSLNHVYKIPICYTVIRIRIHHLTISRPMSINNAKEQVHFLNQVHLFDLRTHNHWSFDFIFKVITSIEIKAKMNYRFMIHVHHVSSCTFIHQSNLLFPSDGTATRTATIRQSPHWLMNNGGGTSSRSGSNPSSDFSCLTQNTNLIFGSNDTAATAIPVTHYGFPSNSKSHSLINGTTSIRSASLDQQQQPSSNNSTPNRMKKLFYEVVVWSRRNWGFLPLPVILRSLFPLTLTLTSLRHLCWFVCTRACVLISSHVLK